ncbi:hypothetical protein Vadar_006947 [Vaccinium darrowii]|uniref:Uncharacterized protein n=1 Tax=Vaccinium darrowii TaxID=229202 RepID=A0ACB7YCN5_9ERIC|nr:hypothetical protein Vadar_006947 [Vaccinium darrowii]
MLRVKQNCVMILFCGVWKRMGCFMVSTWIDVRRWPVGIVLRLLLEYCCYSDRLSLKNCCNGGVYKSRNAACHLSVVGGALYHVSLVDFKIPFNIEGSKYMIDMVRGGPGSYRLRMNESEIEAEMHTLRDRVLGDNS